jgi:hypothetical protein
LERDTDVKYVEAKLSAQSLVREAAWAAAGKKWKNKNQGPYLLRTESETFSLKTEAECTLDIEN